MAEIILGLLCIAAGVGLLCLALLVAVANGIGGATAPHLVTYTPAYICLALALAAFVGGGFLLF